jgi:hypothetical protein
MEPGIFFASVTATTQSSSAGGRSAGITVFHLSKLRTSQELSDYFDGSFISYNMPVGGALRKSHPRKDAPSPTLCLTVKQLKHGNGTLEVMKRLCQHHARLLPVDNAQSNQGIAINPATDVLFVRFKYRCQSHCDPRPYLHTICSDNVDASAFVGVQTVAIEVEIATWAEQRRCQQQIYAFARHIPHLRELLLVWEGHNRLLAGMEGMSHSQAVHVEGTSLRVFPYNYS